MQAVVTRTGASAPLLEEVTTPVVGHDDVRIAVAAAAVNPVDTLVATNAQVRQAFALPDPAGLGWDVSGRVTEVGTGVTDLAVGDPVAGLRHLAELPRVGTHAPETVLPQTAVALVPEGLDVVAAGSLPLNTLTAQQLLDRLGPAEGRSLLITGAAGAVGGFAVALAARAGWRVTALARPTDEEFVRRAGATALLSTIDEPVHDAVLDAAVMGAAALAGVRDGGAFVGVGSALPVASTRSIRVRTANVQPDAAALTALLRLAAAGVLEPRVAGQVPLTGAATAYDKTAGGGQRGRWLLIP
jgi:NADPH:quinone reductase-like Zn-dependent oxidoreductase